MAKSSSQPFLKNLSKWMPTNPGGPPLPKKEILAVLKALRAQLDRLIAAVEKHGEPKGGGSAGRSKAAGKRKKKSAAAA